MNQWITLFFWVLHNIHINTKQVIFAKSLFSHLKLCSLRLELWHSLFPCFPLCTNNLISSIYFNNFPSNKWDVDCVRSSCFFLGVSGTKCSWLIIHMICLIPIIIEIVSSCLIPISPKNCCLWRTVHLASNVSIAPTTLICATFLRLCVVRWRREYHFRAGFKD